MGVLRYPKRTCGQALVEYALVMPFLILLLCTMIESGRLFLTWHQAAGAARHGARQACLWRTSSTLSLDNLVNSVRAHAVKDGSTGVFRIVVTVDNNSPCVYDSRSGWASTPALPVTQPGVPIKVKVFLTFNKLCLPLALIPNEVSDYEIRYSEGEPNRS